MSDVFISHSSKDKDIADKVVEYLEERGLTCWIAPRDIVPGSNWASSISTAITASKVFLVIYSENSSESDQVTKEISLAEAKKNVTVLPYKIDQTELTGAYEYYLTGAHWIYADYKKKDYKLEELYQIITGITGKNIQNITNNTYIDHLHIHGSANISSDIPNVVSSSNNNVKTPAAPVPAVQKKSPPAPAVQKKSPTKLKVILFITIPLAVIIILIICILIFTSGNNTQGNNTEGGTSVAETSEGSSDTEPAKSSFEYTINGGLVEITKFIGSEAGVNIPSTIEGKAVTSIGDDAFNGCTSLTSITIPNSVTSIGGGAFIGCTSLTSITIPNSVTSIGDDAFHDCSSLTNITIPDSVTSIGWSTFSGCTSLTSITIPNSVTSILGYAFDDCTSLTSITIPDSVTFIGVYAFSDCTSLTSIRIPKSVKGIGNNAFKDCKHLTIYGERSIFITCAETYAKENNIPFVAE